MAQLIYKKHTNSSKNCSVNEYDNSTQHIFYYIGEEHYRRQ